MTGNVKSIFPFFFIEEHVLFDSIKNEEMKNTKFV